jgi:hypothetical protein
LIATVHDALPAATSSPWFDPPIATVPGRAPAIRVVPTVPQDPIGASLLTAGRWIGAMTGSLVLVTCLSVIGVLIGELTKTRGNVGGSLAGIAAALAVGLSMGMLLMYVCQRTYAKMAFALLSLILIAAGILMMAYAPVFKQMNSPSIAEYRAFDDLVGFGAGSLVAGLALGALCMRWATRPHARERLARMSRLLGTAYGIWLGMSGVSLIFTLLTLVNGEQTVDTSGNIHGVVYNAIAITAIAAWAFVPGIILTYQGISESVGEGSSEFRPPIAAFGFAAFGTVLLLGQLNMRSSEPIAAPMPVLHVLAAGLPGLTYAAMAGRGSVLRGMPVRWLTWRQVTLAMAISMGVGTMIALYVEVIGGYVGVVLMLVHTGAFALARDGHDINQIYSNANEWLGPGERLVAGLIVGSICAPLAEEFGKSIGVRLLFRPATTRAHAFQLGACAGAGFGFLEALLYGLSGINDDLDHWWQIMVIRGGSTSLHVLCTGLAGVGWWYWARAGRPRIAAALFALAVLFHALWNAFAEIINSRILGLDAVSDHTLEIVAYTVIAIVSLAFITAIPFVAGALRDDTPAPVEGTPLAAMTPWLA